MRLAILIGAMAMGGSGLAAAALISAANTRVAGTEWGSDPPCGLEVVRFHRDGTAHVFYDSVYDFVDADEATWSQRGSVLTLKIDDEEYRGRFSGDALHLVNVSASADRSSAATCAFAHASRRG